MTDGAEAVLVGGGKGQPQVVRLEPAGANPHPAAQALEEQAAKSAYFIGNDPARWRTGVAHYGRVRYEAVYPGIDLVYYGAGRQLEYDWVVAPGAEPGRIQLRFGPGTPVRLEGASGEVALGRAGPVDKTRRSGGTYAGQEPSWGDSKRRAALGSRLVRGRKQISQASEEEPTK